MDDSATQSSGKKRISMPMLLLSLILPLGGFAIMWFVFMRPMEEREKLRETGLKAPGRLLDVETTGTSYNKSPELELTVEFRRKDGVLDTATTYFVPVKRMLYRYHPGVDVTVAYNPANPDEVTIDGIAGPGDAPAGHTASHGGAVPDGEVDALRRTTDSLRRVADSLAARGK
jgi:Protein of unknown function (DUF3592)